jgi:hypothetical protein
MERRDGMNKRLFALIALFSMVLSQSLCMAENVSLSRFADSGRPIKVFLGKFTNESGQSQINASDFEKRFEEALENRKSVPFKMVPAASESDVQISCAIKNYMYSETDPITSYGGAAIFLLDAATAENYVEMTGDFSVIDTKSGSVLLREPFKSFIKHPMTPEESVPLIYEKLSREFLAKSFGKPKKDH